MTRYQDHRRERDKTVSFRMSQEEHRQLEERVRITGLTKNDYIVRSLLEQTIALRAGKFESDRLSLEVRRLSRALEAAQTPEEAVPLLLECRALMEQFLQITCGKKEEVHHE